MLQLSPSISLRSVAGGRSAYPFFRLPECLHNPIPYLVKRPAIRRPQQYGKAFLSPCCIRISGLGAIADAARQALATQWNIQNGKCIQAEARAMELGRRVHHGGRFPEYQFPIRRRGSPINRNVLSIEEKDALHVDTRKGASHA
jgi:hypothetical protein